MENVVWEVKDLRGVIVFDLVLEGNIISGIFGLDEIILIILT
ncbi:hypothetical protein [Methanococcoides sp. FTZ1]